MMKKLWILPLLLVLLSGCSAQQTMETVADVYAVPVSATVYEMSVQLPEAAAQFVMEGPDGGKFFQCENYTVEIQTMAGGDLERTIRQLTGIEINDLTIMQTLRDGFKCYECAWAAVGEGTEQICRAVILDDGNSHHVMSLMADYTEAGALADDWMHILDSARLVSTG